MPKSSKYVWHKDDITIEKPTKEAAGLMGNFQKTDGAKLQNNPKVHQVPVDKRPYKGQTRKNVPKNGPLQ